MKKTPFRIVSQLVLTILAITILSSCNKTPKHLKYIPKDAIFISGFDGKSIALKTVDFKKILDFDFLNNKDVKNDSLADLLKFSGIDLLGKAFVFATPYKEDRYGVKINAVVALDDAQDFANFMAKEAKKHGYKFTDKGDIHYFNHESGVAMAWNSEVLLMSALIDRSGISSGKSIVQNLMALKEEESILKNEKFVELQKKEADVTFWLNYEFMDNYKELSSQYTTMFGKDFTFKDTYIAATVNFENGKIKSELISYCNDSYQKKFGKLINTNLNEAVTKNHPGKELNGLIGFSVNMKEVQQLLKNMNLTQTLDQAMAKDGFTSADLFDAISGDIILSMNGVTKQAQPKYNFETGAIDTVQATIPSFSMSLGIGNKAKFDKFIALFESKMLLQKTGTNEYNAMGKAFFVIKDKSIVAVSSADLAKEVASNKFTPVNDDHKKLLSNNAMVFDINIAKLDTGLVNQFGISAQKTFAEQPLESINITATALVEGKSTGNIEVNFKNKEQNSLVTLYETVKKAKDIIPNPLAPTAPSYDADMYNESASAPDSAQVSY